jgi:hypothetical protein
MIYAATRGEIESLRKAFIRKWPLKHRAVADSFQEAGDREVVLPHSNQHATGVESRCRDLTDCRACVDLGRGGSSFAGNPTRAAI